MIASSLIGGGNYSQAAALVLDSLGDAYITGSSGGITPGATPGAYQTQVSNTCLEVNIGPGLPPAPSDAFVLKLDPTLSSAQYLTYLGGPCGSSGNSIALDPNGDVWLAGFPSLSLPLVMPYEFGGTGSYFVSEFNPDLSQLLFSSYSDGPNLAMDPTGAIYVSGTSQYPGGVHKNAASTSTASLVKIDPTGTPPVIINSIGPVNANASSVRFPQIGPGGLVNIGGENLGPSNTVMAKLTATGQLPFLVGATSVSFNGYSAPLISVQAGLIECVAPFEISGATLVTVNVDGQSSNSMLIAVAASAPYILEVINQDGTVNSANHPAPQGSVVTFYMTGFGLTSPLSQDGSVSAPPLPVPVASISASINQNPILPQFVAAADGMVAGITQINIQIPVAAYSSNMVGADINGAVAEVYIVQ